MKTLLIGSGWFPENAGGLDRVYYDCVHYLSQEGVEIRGLVVGSSDVEQNSGGLVGAFAPSDLPLLSRWSKVRGAVKQLLNAEDFPLVVSHFALYTFPILNLLGDRPLVIHFHGPWARESQMEGSGAIATRLKWLLERITYQRASQFIVLSNAFRQILHQEYHVPLAKIHVIPSGADVQRFDIALTRSEARAKLHWSQQRPIILSVRRLAARMGLENLIAAISQVRQHYPEVLLLIAGKGALRATLQAQIDAMDLGENVHLLGFVSEQDLIFAYRAADFTVVPTIDLEGFGLIITESLAAGTPVMGTPVGGIPEILLPFSQDLLFAGSSVEQLAQGMIEVLSGDRKLPSSEACQSYVQANYAWEVIAKKMKSVYELAKADTLLL